MQHGGLSSINSSCVFYFFITIKFQHKLWSFFWKHVHLSPGYGPAHQQNISAKHKLINFNDLPADIWRNISNCLPVPQVSIWVRDTTARAQAMTPFFSLIILRWPLMCLIHCFTCSSGRLWHLTLSYSNFPGCSQALSEHKKKKYMRDAGRTWIWGGGQTGFTRGASASPPPPTFRSRHIGLRTIIWQW